MEKNVFELNLSKYQRDFFMFNSFLKLYSPAKIKYYEREYNFFLEMFIFNFILFI